MLPFVEITSIPPRPSMSGFRRSLNRARPGGPAAVAAWLLTLVSPADGAALRDVARPGPERSMPLMDTLTESLTCDLLWFDYHVRRALGLPCTPPNC